VFFAVGRGAGVTVGLLPGRLRMLGLYTLLLWPGSLLMLLLHMLLLHTLLLNVLLLNVLLLHTLLLNVLLLYALLLNMLLWLRLRARLYIMRMLLWRGPVFSLATIGMARILRIAGSAILVAKRCIFGHMPLLGKWAAAHPVHGSCCRPAVVYSSKLTLVFAGHLLVLHLPGRRLYMMYVHGRALFGGGGCPYTARAIKTCMVIYCSVVNNRAVDKGVMDNRSVYIRNSRVVTEMPPRPITAYKTNA